MFFSGYVCEHSPTQLKGSSDTIRDIIISNLKATVQTGAIRLAAYKALDAWFKHLKPKFETKTEYDKMDGVFARHASDSLDIVNAICDCWENFCNVMRSSRFENVENVAGTSSGAKRMRGNESLRVVSPSPDRLPSTPNPKFPVEQNSPAGSSSSDGSANRCVKLNLNRKRILSLSLYKKSLLNAAKKYRNR